MKDTASVDIALTEVEKTRGQVLLVSVGLLQGLLFTSSIESE